LDADEHGFSGFVIRQHGSLCERYGLGGEVGDREKVAKVLQDGISALANHAPDAFFIPYQLPGNGQKRFSCVQVIS